MKAGGKYSWVSYIVDKYHVGTPDSEIRAEIRKRCKRAKTPSAECAKIVAAAIRRHHANLKVYQDVMGGRLKAPPVRKMRKKAAPLTPGMSKKKWTGETLAKSRKALTKGNPCRNPRLPSDFAPGRARKVYSRILKIRASKAGLPHDCDAACKRANHIYEHDFTTKNAGVWGLEDGRLLIG